MQNSKLKTNSQLGAKVAGIIARSTQRTGRFHSRLTIDLLIQLQISVNLDDCRTPVGLGRQASRIRSRGLLTRLGAVARPKARPPPRLATREEAPNWTRPHLRRGRTRRLLPRPQHPGRLAGPRRLSARPNRRLVCSISSDTL